MRNARNRKFNPVEFSAAKYLNTKANTILEQFVLPLSYPLAELVSIHTSATMLCIWLLDQSMI